MNDASLYSLLATRERPSDRSPNDEEIIAGLCAAQAEISPKYFYDLQGSALFERITGLHEYYPTRTEMAIMSEYAGDIAGSIGDGATLIEFGAGNCEKARALCALIEPKCFVAVDIASDFVRDAANGLRCTYPALDIHVVSADLEDEIELPADVPRGQRLGFYPGSSIGNFEPEQALRLLRRIRGLLGEGGALLIGVDLVKDEAVLEAAYNDAAGVTAAFNLNVLRHLNRLIGSDFDLRDWRHRAFFNRAKSRIEMHLDAAVDARVGWLGGKRFFRRGEDIHTENSYKYALGDFARMLELAGFAQQFCWTDPKQWFAVFLARV